ncbi:hypothetical protein [Streptomyces sp. NBC_01477]|uniref:hypothetical protein n=1 Tax=Streptomyces sp. NBC_01477 TaxID=2976015 RepID=UPI002E339AE2|nr:hypothetical protein [Streptomyces sp. NBC_01477]
MVFRPPLLLVLLCPCVDYVIVFSGLAWPAPTTAACSPGSGRGTDQQDTHQPTH